MVSFVCNSCQETLKKAKLDQHYGRCRGASFTCIDCNTDFAGTQYRSHSSCISEAEKYQKSMFKQKQSKVQNPQVKKVETPKIEETKKDETKEDETVSKVVERLLKKKRSVSLIYLLRKVGKKSSKSQEELLKHFCIDQSKKLYFK